MKDKAFFNFFPFRLSLLSRKPYYTYLNFLWKHCVAVERDEFVAKGLFEVALAIDVEVALTAFVQYRQAAVDKNRIRVSQSENIMTNL